MISQHPENLKNSEVESELHSQCSSSTDEDICLNLPPGVLNYMRDFSGCRFKRRLSAGLCSEVWLIDIDKGKCQRAIKIINKSQMSESQRIHAISEVSALKDLKSPHFVKIYQIVEIEQYIYIEMEYLEQGDLADYFNTEPVMNLQRTLSRLNVSRKLIGQISVALNEVHRQGYVFQDLKPENILFTKQGKIKLCDFGLALPVGTIDMSLCGTLEYMAPERLSALRNSLPLQYSSDMWSLGVMAFQILKGELPYSSEEPNQLLERIFQGNLNFEPDFPKSAKNLITKLLNPNYKKRPTFQEIKCHPFFTESQDFQWDELENRFDLGSGYLKITDKEVSKKAFKTEKQSNPLFS